MQSRVQTRAEGRGKIGTLSRPSAVRTTHTGLAPSCVPPLRILTPCTTDPHFLRFCRALTSIAERHTVEAGRAPSIRQSEPVSPANETGSVVTAKEASSVRCSTP
jgi:hypothetical protein